MVTRLYKHPKKQNTRDIINEFNTLQKRKIELDQTYEIIVLFDQYISLWNEIKIDYVSKPLLEDFSEVFDYEISTLVVSSEIDQDDKDRHK